MATLQSTQTFTTGQVLTASALTNHVVEATPLPDFISARTNLTTGVASGDELLINDVDGGAVKKVTVANLAANLPTGTTAADITVTNGATVNGTLTANGNTVIGDASTDTATVNATSTFGGAASFNNNTTIGSAAVTGTYSRSTTTLTVTSNNHGLSNGNTRWFIIENNSVLSGSYSVSSVTTNTFTITVVDSGATSGNISWYERTSTIQSALAGSIHGDAAVNAKTVQQGSGDEVLIKDSSDSNKLRTVEGSVIKAWAKIDWAYTTITGNVTRANGSTTATITYSGHALRVGDVIFTTGGIVSNWYAVVSVIDSSTFTVTTAATTPLSAVSISWYKHNIIAGSNVYCAYGRNDLRAFQIGFINKPASATGYSVIGSVWGVSNKTYYPPQFNPATFVQITSTYLQTVNGFGVWLQDYDAGGVSETTGQFDFKAIW